ncbi:MAG: PrsW family glutamic-type intramembrane protease [Candidatus Methylacidiphilales bacterium]|nr:PrsW family glutamic-type intramembrane protease [Candidatus Methylacidiphilales bacterium]
MLRQRGQNSLLGDGLTHLAAAFLGGLFAVTGAFLVNLILPENSGWGWLNTLVFGPVCEELLKASGAIYLLEKCPYRLHSGPALAAVVIASAFIFAVCENLLYVHVYVDVARLKHPMDYLLFRWTAPTALHLVCSAIASLGLMRIWHRDIRTGHTADLDTAYPFFATAMVLHGGYNLLAILGDSFLFPKA